MTRAAKEIVVAVLAGQLIKSFGGKGLVDDAVAIARNSIDRELLYRCRMIARQWSELAQENVSAARGAEVGSHDHARLWSSTMIGSTPKNGRLALPGFSV